ncbi:hypothetical protein LOK49_Contig1G00009 [Camellia lanceoleosa]|nr:hypothetical protein LOK49_Contig1G00009 [Camellia lanceoleosa]
MQPPTYRPPFRRRRPAPDRQPRTASLSDSGAAVPPAPHSTPTHHHLPQRRPRQAPVYGPPSPVAVLPAVVYAVPPPPPHQPIAPPSSFLSLRWCCTGGKPLAPLPRFRLCALLPPPASLPHRRPSFHPAGAATPLRRLCSLFFLR